MPPRKGSGGWKGVRAAVGMGGLLRRTRDSVTVINSATRSTVNNTLGALNTIGDITKDTLMDPLRDMTAMITDSSEGGQQERTERRRPP